MALEGAADPREFAYRYEYYKATFDELASSLQGEGVGKRPAQQQAAEQMPGMDVVARLEEDHAVVNEMRNGDPFRVDTDLSPESLEQEVRAQAGGIEMGHQTASAYHARKHHDELPPGEREGGVVSDYLNSAEQTLRHGDISDVASLDGGAQRWTFVRSSLDFDGNQLHDRKGRPVYMRAFVIIRPDGTLVMPTYGSTTLE